MSPCLLNEGRFFCLADIEERGVTLTLDSLSWFNSIYTMIMMTDKWFYEEVGNRSVCNVC